MLFVCFIKFVQILIVQSESMKQNDLSKITGLNMLNPVELMSPELAIINRLLYPKINFYTKQELLLSG